MGFEQLAALKKQLSEQAKAEKAAKSAEVPKRATSPRARDSAPVDPVVHAIARLQRRLPLAFPKNPAPKVPLKIGTIQIGEGVAPR